VVDAEECQVCQGSLMSLVLSPEGQISIVRLRCRSFARVEYKLASLAAKILRCSNS